MSGYQTIVVGTDGSDSSLRAVDKAGQIAAGSGAKVVVATAYFPQSEDQRAADVLKDEGYKMAGNAPIYAILREARDRAHQAGATNIEEKAVVEDGQFVARPLMAMTLTCDHRAIDGAKAAEFLRELKTLLEEPGLAL